MLIYHTLSTFFLLMGILWFAGLIHCALNRYLRGGEKIAWVLLFFFTNWIGSLIYFVYWYGYAKQRRSQIAYQAQPRYQATYQAYQPDYVPQPKQSNGAQQTYATYEQSYAPYTQGYQPVKRAAMPIKPFIVEAKEEKEVISPLYEQPQVMYPEDPR